MLLACIIESTNVVRTTDLIEFIFTSKKRSINIFDQRTGGLHEYVKSLNKNIYDVSIIRATISDLGALKAQNLRFDILVFEDIDNNSFVNSFVFFRSILALLKPHAYLIVNSDNFDFFNHFALKNYYVITYGFNRYANLSTSSVGDMLNNSNFMCFLTKTVHSYNGTIFEPQEYVLNLTSFNNTPYNILAAAVFAIINGIDLTTIT